MPFFSPRGEPLQNPYELLNLTHGTCTDDDIAKSFKKLMLQLHPDKQPPGQSPEEAEAVAQKLHDVMDAKSFLLDGEHLAAKREYDAKLAKAKMMPPPPVVGQVPLPAKGAAPAAKNSASHGPSAAAAAAAAAEDHKPTSQHGTKKSSGHDEGTVKNNYKRSSSGGAKKKSDAKAHAAEISKKNVNVKQWGRPSNTRRNGSGQAHNKAKSGGGDKIKANKETKAKVSTENKNCNPMKNKMHARMRANLKAFNDSCGDCSTTDDCNSTSDDEGKRRHTYANNHVFNSYHKPSTNRPPNVHRVKNKVKMPIPSANPHSHDIKKRAGPERSKSDQAIPGGRVRSKSFDDTNDKQKACPKRSSSDFKEKASSNEQQQTQQKQQQQGSNPKSGYKPSEAPLKADFSNFYPAINILQKQYHCPLTKEVMKDPMSDFEGNSYERAAILKYLETNTTSPVTGNPLFAMHLTPNVALKEKIKYTMKLKTCLDSLQQQQTGNVTSQQQQQPQNNSEVVYRSLRDAVDVGFIKDLNSGSPSITIPQLNDSGTTSFSYLGLKFRLDVPGASVADNVIVQTWFDHSKKAANISGRIVQFNAALQKMGLGGKLTFRNMNGKHAFTLTKKMDPEQFSKTSLRHAIEYFMEMSIKLHNIINTSDIKRVDKVRLVSNVACQ